MDDELPYFQLRPPKRRPLRDRGWIVGIAAGGVVIVLVLVVGVRAVLVRALCAQDPIRLHVAAALDVAPAVQRIGQYFNDLNRNVGGHCAQVEVTEDPSDAVAAERAGLSTILRETPLDAWVPDCSRSAASRPRPIGSPPLFPSSLPQPPACTRKRGPPSPRSPSHPGMGAA